MMLHGTEPGVQGILMVTTKLFQYLLMAVTVVVLSKFKLEGLLTGYGLRDDKHNVPNACCLAHHGYHRERRRERKKTSPVYRLKSGEFGVFCAITVFNFFTVFFWGNEEILLLLYLRITHHTSEDFGKNVSLNILAASALVDDCGGGCCSMRMNLYMNSKWSLLLEFERNCTIKLTTFHNIACISINV